jgi:hypothetical protein
MASPYRWDGPGSPPRLDGGGKNVGASLVAPADESPAHEGFQLSGFLASRSLHPFQFAPIVNEYGNGASKLAFPAQASSEGQLDKLGALGSSPVLPDFDRHG